MDFYLFSFVFLHYYVRLGTALVEHMQCQFGNVLCSVSQLPLCYQFMTHENC